MKFKVLITFVFLSGMNLSHAKCLVIVSGENTYQESTAGSSLNECLGKSKEKPSNAYLFIGNGPDFKQYFFIKEGAILGSQIVVR